MNTETLNIIVNRTNNSKIDSINWDDLPFGRIFSDHMFVMDYKDGKWENAEIKEFSDLKMSPATSILHYGQTFFEGMKATKTEDGEILLFRPEENAKRFNISAERMCMPGVPIPLFMEALKTLLDVDRNWVPQKSGY